MPLLEDVLALIPIPSLVNFTKVLNNQVVALDTFLPFTKNAKTFGVHPKVRIDFCLEILDSYFHNLS